MGDFGYLERLRFLRRITKYPIQVTKSTTRLLQRDSSIRRRHTLGTVQARLLAVHFYLESCAWPAEFVLAHDKRVAVFSDLAVLAGGSRNVLPHGRWQAPPVWL